MESNSLRKLTADEYIAEEKRWTDRFNEYTNKKVDINQREHADIDNVANDSLSHSEKVDIYFKYYKKKSRTIRRREKTVGKRVSEIYFDLRN